MTAITITSNTLSDAWTALAVEGEIDLATVPTLEKAMDEVFNGDEKSLVIDLTRSEFMDSTGLRALVVEQRRFEEAGRSFAIAVSAGPIGRLIDLSGIQSSIRVVDRPEAVLGE